MKNNQCSISKYNYNLIKKEALRYPNVETGGMLFGEIKKKDFNSYRIYIKKVIIPPSHLVKRSGGYFEIDLDFLKEKVRSEKDFYLGNWHKHLFIGGPSSMDIDEIKEFFRLNPHRDKVMAFIYADNGRSHDLFIELYIRLPSANRFKIIKINRDKLNIVEKLPSEANKSDKSENYDKNYYISVLDELEKYLIYSLGRDQCRLELLKGIQKNEWFIRIKLSYELKELFLPNEIEESRENNKKKSSPKRKDLKNGHLEKSNNKFDNLRKTSLKTGKKMKTKRKPIQEKTQLSSSKKNVPKKYKFTLQISFPPNFPEGEIYIDLCSRDCSKLNTVEILDSRLVFNNRESFFTKIENIILNKVTKLLDIPVYFFLTEKNPEREPSNKNRIWRLCSL